MRITKQAMTWLLLVAVVLAATGQSVQAQTPPASIDTTTPRTQNGLTLLAVTRGDAQGQYVFPVPANLDFLSGPRSNGPAGGIGLWVRGVKPAPPRQVGTKNGRMPFYQSYANVTGSATALNGDSLPVQVETASSYSYDARTSPPAPLFLVTLPGGYPSGYPAIDLSMNDSSGHSARWRLIRLTAPYHAITPPIALHTAFSGAGAGLMVHAWRGSGFVTARGTTQYQPWQNGVHYGITARVPAGSRWIVRIFKRQLEWEAVRPQEIAALQARNGPQYTNMLRRQPLWMAAFGPGPQPPMQDMIPTPYGKYNRYLRLSGVLVQMASASENVTFHNLNVHQSAPPTQFGGPRGYTPPPSYEIGTRPQSVVTPSGISVTLLPLSALGQGNTQYGGYGPGSVRLLLRFGQPLPQPASFPQSPLVLPRSPLYKKYHKPVTYSLSAQKPYSLDAMYGGFQRPGMPVQMLTNLRLPYAPPVRTVQNGRVFFRSAPAALPKHLSSLTFSVIQQAELRSVPFSFLVPIDAQFPRQSTAVPRRLVR